jgi:hypothetical protein
MFLEITKKFIKMKNKKVISILVAFCFLAITFIAGCTKNIDNTYSNVLVLGNSITKHPITSYWWGEWGMAASTKENDFVHKLEKMLQTSNPNCTVEGYQIWDWERNHTTYDKSKLDTFFISKPDLVIIRLGENVVSLTNFDVSLQNLVNYIKEKVPDARIIITGVFWTSAPKDSIFSAVARSNNLTFVELSSLNIAANKAFMGATVYDALGIAHFINNQSVANHPNDIGMTAIANALFRAIKDTNSLQK